MLNQTSIVDRNRSINEAQWVVSLVAKPQSKNPEHAILLIEGLINDKCIFRRYDYVVDVAKRKKGLVVIKEKEYDFREPLDERQQFF